jgi:sugar (pentulose or hexulose) kinase
MKECVLIVDISTSKVQANLIGLISGDLLEHTIYTYQWIHPFSGWSEVDANAIWESTQEAVEDVIEIGKNKYAITAIGFSWFGDNLLLVGSDGVPLGNMILSFDNRAGTEAQQLLDEYGEEKLIEVAGFPIQGDAVPAKVLWFKKYKPQEFNKAAYFLSIQQFIIMKLGLGIITDYSLACRKIMFEIKNLRWSESLCNYLGLPVEKLGENVLPANSIIGSIRKFGNVDLGREIPVILGAHNSESGMIGLGCFPGSDAVLANLSSTFDLIGYLVSSYSDKYAGFLGSYCGPFEGSYAILGSTIPGPNLDWLIKIFYPDEGQSALNQLFEMYPLDGTNKTILSKGIQTGDGIIRGLNLTTTQEDLFKAVIEGVTFPLMGVISQLEKVNENKFDSVRIGGSGARFDRWSQLKADMFGVRVEKVKNIEVSSMGAAIMAAVELGHFQNYPEARKQMIGIDKIFEPRPEINQRYKKRFEEYLEIVG